MKCFEGKEEVQIYISLTGQVFSSH